MKKTMLWGALFSLICTQVQAEVTQQPTQAQASGSVNAPAIITPQAPATMQATPNNQPIQGAQQIPSVQPQTAPAIDCDYKISNNTKKIDDSLVLTWSEKAATQAFDFTPAMLESQMQHLKNCFTDQGWIGYSSALDKSGNLAAIKAQNLTVSSQVDGQAQLTESKNNQWKIILPVQVVYQNNKEKVTQLLNINLTVSRKTSGDLGIIQIIATPRAAVSMQQNAPVNNTNPLETTTSTNSNNVGTPPNPSINPAPTQQPPTTGPAPINKQIN